ncbi:ATP phosphoribosyltransferase regulatory subunit [Virgibacillus sp. DJP39]|uniref:ATP phosphoribosyltransferase regulatory subunit n=1 Tax=Virgibacillus sp. DJP39 TaxID=3409790 RepID=UPI003BB76271
MNFDRSDDLSISDFSKKAYLLRTIKNNFLTYGYREVETPTFESYDLYQSITGTVKHDSMIKIIDPTGKILVMRPDVTVPITKMQVTTPPSLAAERLFYIENVFRLAGDQQGKKEWTQAGVENYGPSSTETDAEVISLAVQVLRNLGFKSIQIQVGLASFFRPLLDVVSLTDSEIKELQSLIRAKNISELELFLSKRDVPEELQYLLIQIPYLYGDFTAVTKRAKELLISDSMVEQIQKLEDLHKILKLYDVDRFVSLDLGLINHMDYYSGIIFQGYVENVGKPVLMGGRYDQLASQIGSDLPAIGFACESDVLLEALDQGNLFKPDAAHIDVLITYDTVRQKEAIQSAEALRKGGLRVIVTAKTDEVKSFDEITTIHYTANDQVVTQNGECRQFNDVSKLVNLLTRNKGEM